MEYLSKVGKLSNQAAALVIFVAWYLSATITTMVVAGTAGRIVGAFLMTLLAVFVFMTVVFAVSRKVNRTDVVDVAWGPAFVVAAIASFALNTYDAPVGLNVQTLVTILVSIWAGRLAYTILKRLLRKSEDPRYVALRKKWKGNEFLNTYLRIFVTQAVLATVVSIAVINVNGSLPTNLTSPFVYVGVIIWIIGFVFEAVGDMQLKKFLANPKNKGKLMTRGLWSYTRHPNYFGEAAMWWGIFVIGLSVPFGWFGIVTPVIITYLLYFVSGVPMTEESFNGKPGWEQYKKRTSKFFPLPPNKD